MDSYDAQYAKLAIMGEIPINSQHNLPLLYPPMPDDEEERDLARLRQLGLGAATDLFGVMLELDQLVDRVDSSSSIS